MIVMSERDAAKLFPGAAQPVKRQPKYKNHKVYVYEDGAVLNEKAEGHGRVKEHYDSQKEYDRWCELKLLARAGKISGLKRQVPLTIMEGFTEAGEVVLPINYVADHMYTENGRTVVEDVKGQDKYTGKFITTKDFNLKWKLLRSKYRSYQFRIV